LFPRRECSATAVRRTVSGIVPHSQCALLTRLAGAGAISGFVLGAIFSIEQVDGGEEFGVVAAQLFLTVYDLVENLVGLGKERGR
jgi:hypothetical protein